MYVAVEDTRLFVTDATLDDKLLITDVFSGKRDPRMVDTACSCNGSVDRSEFFLD